MIELKNNVHKILIIYKLHKKRLLSVFLKSKSHKLYEKLNDNLVHRGKQKPPLPLQK